MSKYILVTMVFEPENGSTLEFDELHQAVKESVKMFAPEPTAELTVIEVRDTDDDEGEYDELEY